MSARQLWAEPTQFQVRAAGSHDHARVARFLAAMDRDGLYERHFAHGEAPNLALLRRMEALDQRERVAVLAVGYEGEVLGHAEYVAEHGAAEFALMVLPLFRHHGIGRRLLNALLELATAVGQREMHGIIQATNTRALQLVRNSGFRLVPGEDRTTVIASRSLPPIPEAVQTGLAIAADRHPPPFIRHDPDRTPLHRRSGPGAPLRAGGG
ncbi:MAG: GNAT family N-acetyltransferase [Rhodocyclales bacterium]|nr:GNAT family N-acetyltransferase [Rhodocyclales bacterium]